MDTLVDTRVIFKMSRWNDWKECVAFLLDCPANDGYILSYMTVGQHGEASMGFFQECKPATEEQYQDLYKELTSIGYRLYVRSRWNGNRKSQRWEGK
jgi:hypothetical protein